MRISEHEVFDTFGEAADARGDRDHLEICAVQTGPDKGRYFLIDRDADDATVRDVSFAIREGRELGEGERSMIDLIDAQVAPGFMEVTTDGGPLPRDRGPRAAPPDRPAADPDDAVGVEGALEAS